MLNETHDFGDDEFFYPGRTEPNIYINSSPIVHHNKFEGSPSKNSRNTEIINGE
jgi:hypothetical protein